MLTALIGVFSIFKHVFCWSGSPGCPRIPSPKRFTTLHNTAQCIPFYYNLLLAGLKDFVLSFSRVSCVSDKSNLATPSHSPRAPSVPSLTELIVTDRMRESCHGPIDNRRLNYQRHRQAPSCAARSTGGSVAAVGWCVCLWGAILIKSLSKLGPPMSKAYDSLSLSIDYLLISGLSRAPPLSVTRALFSHVSQQARSLGLRVLLSLNLFIHSQCNQSRCLPPMCIANTFQFVAG